MNIAVTPHGAKMSTAVTPRNGPAPAAIENVVIRGDLSKLTEAERTTYYMAVCRSVGLNPLTKPMEYITLNGKLTLYALRNCTDQLRAIHKISVADMAEDGTRWRLHRHLQGQQCRGPHRHF